MQLPCVPCLGRQATGVVCNLRHLRHRCASTDNVSSSCCIHSRATVHSMLHAMCTSSALTAALPQPCPFIMQASTHQICQLQPSSC